MTVLRFFHTLFLFICLLAGSGALVVALCLMVRFPLLMLATVLACILLAIILKKVCSKNP